MSTIAAAAMLVAGTVMIIAASAVGVLLWVEGHKDHDRPAMWAGVGILVFLALALMAAMLTLAAA
jgi:hypothetical protein